MNHRCPLCNSADTCHFYTETDHPPRRSFHHCDHCDLIFVPSEYWLPRRTEHSRYLQHDNAPHEFGYRNFLGRFADVLLPYLHRPARGLDYGCGPCPLLSWLLKEAGFLMSIYDPLFAPDIGVLSRRYQFITCTETVEHFRDPVREFIRFSNMIKPGGNIGIMTGMLDDPDKFRDWHYRNDDTHLCFYSKKTFRWIANAFSWTPQFPADNIVVFDA